MAHDEHRQGHSHVHLDEAHWGAWAAQTEREGEVLLAFVTDTAAWVAGLRDPQAPPVLRILDIGCGPGVGTCELARCFPEARLVAVDGSAAMLERAARRIDKHGLAARISTHLAELPDGLADLEPADVIWASMSLHHVGDEVASLRLLRELLAPGGLLAIAELGEPTRVLPDELDVGRPGLVDRLDERWSSWFAEMRDDLPGAVPSDDFPSMLAAAGFETVGARLARLHLEPPVSPAARQMAVDHLRRAREHLDEQVDADDLAALDILLDADDERSVARRPDVFIAASRQIVIARPIGGR